MEEDALERETKKVLPRRSSEKRLPERDVFIERENSRKKSGNKNYMKETFSSLDRHKQKEKEIEKIYLNTSRRNKK